MKLTVKTGNLAEISVDLLAIPVFGPRADSAATKPKSQPKLPRSFARLDQQLGGLARAAIESGDFKAGTGQCTLLYPTNPDARVGRVILYGLGDENKLDSERLRNLAGCVATEARNRNLERVAILAPRSRQLSNENCATALAEGSVLGGYRYHKYKTPEKKQRGQSPSHGSLKQTALIFEALARPGGVRQRVREAEITSQGQNLARDLSNAPANVLPPAALAREARKMARQCGLSCRVIRGVELERGGFKALCAVGQGSSNPPQLIILEHRGTRGKRAGKAATLCLIGKGITFDSGGISIKPSAGMQDMKHDMSGAATVVGAMQAAAQLDLPAHVVGIIAAAENMPGGGAYRPGDVIGSHAGKTIEVINTDAEGRLVLADALHYAVTRFKPAAMVDLATLTGACMVALGQWATGVFSNDKDLSDALSRAGDETGECMWPMPLLPDHLRMMRSSVADLKNAGGREAGASTAAAFLGEFVGDTPWAHLDIAGTGWKSPKNAYHSGGATGVGVRTLIAWLRARVQQID